jgi:hypothetical protein
MWFSRLYGRSLSMTVATLLCLVIYRTPSPSDVLSGRYTVVFSPLWAFIVDDGGHFTMSCPVSSSPLDFILGQYAVVASPLWAFTVDDSGQYCPNTAIHNTVCDRLNQISGRDGRYVSNFTA